MTIACPNCNHNNPEDAAHCEACFSPLSRMAECPSCGSSVQADASFCGQCGCDLRREGTLASSPGMATTEITPLAGLASEAGVEVASEEMSPYLQQSEAVGNKATSDRVESVAQMPETEAVATSTAPEAEAAVPPAVEATTVVQRNTPYLLHIQTGISIELPPNFRVVRFGKPNEIVPPDIDLSALPDSEIVSRRHAEIHAESNRYFLEDVGSANGTYVNHSPLPRGSRHQLLPGDLIAFGKEDKVTFLFKIP